MRKIKKLKEIYLEKTCGECYNHEIYQMIYDYPLYCGIMTYIYTAKQYHHHFCRYIYAGKKEKLCQICVFAEDLLIFEEMLYKIENAKSIPKLYKIIKRFYFIMKYWAEINPELMEHFSCFISPFHQCLQIVSKM